MDVLREIIFWLKFNLRIYCTVCGIVLYVTAIYREFMVLWYCSWHLNVHFLWWIYRLCYSQHISWLQTSSSSASGFYFQNKTCIVVRFNCYINDKLLARQIMICNTKHEKYISENKKEYLLFHISIGLVFLVSISFIILIWQKAHKLT